MTRPRVLLTGVSGYIGRALARTLLDADLCETLVGLDLRQPPVSMPGLQFLQADIADPIDSILTTHRIDTIVHAAFVVRPSHQARAMRRTNVEGTRQLLRAASACGVQHLLHFSSASVYGFAPNESTLLRETDPLHPPQGFAYAQQKAEAELLVAAARNAVDIPTITVLRPSFIVGRDSDNPLFEHLARRFVFLPTPMSSLQLTHIDDLCAIVLQLLQHPFNDIFNVGAPGALTPAQMVERLHGTPILLPSSLLRAANHLAWHLRLNGLTNAPSSALTSLQNPWRVDSNKLQHQLNIQFRYDTASAFDTFVRQRAILRYERRFNNR